jgi:hypothetical protein
MLFLTYRQKHSPSTNALKPLPILQAYSTIQYRVLRISPVLKYYKYKFFNLIFSDPVPMTAVIGVVIALLIAFVLLSIFFLVAYKQQKLCFKGGGTHFFASHVGMTNRMIA